MAQTAKIDTNISMTTITTIEGLQIIDSRGNPTVRAYITLSDGSVHSSSVPSGASVGVYEAKELRDHNSKRYFGLGVSQAINNIKNPIRKALTGRNISSPRIIDEILLQLDVTSDKSILGANAILAVSQAVHKASAHSMHIPLWKCLQEVYFPHVKPSFPRLFINVIEGGIHADWIFDIQEFVIIPRKTSPVESVRIGVEIFQSIKKELRSKNLSTLVGDEGGLSPHLNSNEGVFELILEAAVKASFTLGNDYELGIDAAASALFHNGVYKLTKEDIHLTPNQLSQRYEKYIDSYHISYFEDPFAEDDWESFNNFTANAHGRFTVVGDDLFATNIERLKKGIKLKSANAIIIKPNQVGTIFETMEAIQLAKNANWKTIISHRSGDTEDTFMADLAYGTGADFIKAGSMSRSERLAKYNRLLEIEAFEQ